MFRVIECVSRVRVSASAGITPLRRGNSRTSSKVMPSKAILGVIGKTGATRDVAAGRSAAGDAEIGGVPI